MTIKRFHVGKTLSEIAIHGDTIYLAGQIAEDTTHGIEGQTREVLGHIDRLLLEAGSDKTQILMCQIFLSDSKDFAAMNSVWNEWVPEGHSPPRATVEARMSRPELLVEMIVTAAKK